MPWVQDLDLILIGTFFKFGILLFLLKIIIKFVFNNLMFLVILAFSISFNYFEAIFNVFETSYTNKDC